MKERAQNEAEREQAEQLEQIWVGTYVAAYAITLYNYPDLEPQDVDRPAQRHADWVTDVIASKVWASMLKKEKQ